MLTSSAFMAAVEAHADKVDHNPNPPDKGVIDCFVDIGSDYFGMKLPEFEEPRAGLEIKVYVGAGQTSEADLANPEVHSLLNSYNSGLAPLTVAYEGNVWRQGYMVVTTMDDVIPFLGSAAFLSNKPNPASVQQTQRELANAMKTHFPGFERLAIDSPHAVETWSRKDCPIRVMLYTGKTNETGPIVAFQASVHHSVFHHIMVTREIEQYQDANPYDKDFDEIDRMILLRSAEPAFRRLCASMFTNDSSHNYLGTRMLIEGSGNAFAETRFPWNLPLTGEKLMAYARAAARAWGNRYDAPSPRLVPTDEELQRQHDMLFSGIRQLFGF